MYKVCHLSLISYHITTQQIKSNQINSPPYFQSNPYKLHFIFIFQYSNPPHTTSTQFTSTSTNNNYNNVFRQPRNKQRLVPPLPQPPPKIRQDLHRRRRELPPYPIHQDSIPIHLHRLITPPFINNERVPHWDWRLRKQT